MTVTSSDLKRCADRPRGTHGTVRTLDRTHRATLAPDGLLWMEAGDGTWVAALSGLTAGAFVPDPWPGWTGVRKGPDHDRHAGHPDRDQTDERQYR